MPRLETLTSAGAKAQPARYVWNGQGHPRTVSLDCGWSVDSAPGSGDEFHNGFDGNDPPTAYTGRWAAGDFTLDTNRQNLASKAPSRIGWRCASVGYIGGLVGTFDGVTDVDPDTDLISLGAIWF